MLEDIGNARPDGCDNELGRKQAADSMKRVALIFASVVDHCFYREEGCEVVACLAASKTE